MTKEEAIYWKQFILHTIEERLPQVTPSSEDAVRISRFTKQYMQTVNGQTPLPQGLFREFMELFSHIPVIQEDIRNAQAEINTYMEVMDSSTVTREDIDNMFNEENT